MTTIQFSKLWIDPLYDGGEGRWGQESPEKNPDSHPDCAALYANYLNR